MFNIILSANENYIKYAAVLMHSIALGIDKNKHFGDFLATSKWGGGEPKNYCKAFLRPNIKNKFFFYKFLEIIPDSTNEKLIFHILSDFVSQDSQAKLKTLEKELNAIFKIEIHIHILSDEIFHSFPKWGFEKEQNYNAYYRLIFPQIFPNDKPKYVLYLDIDMLVLGDIRFLFALDLGNNFAATNSGYCDFNARPFHQLKSYDKKSIFKFSHKYYFCSGLLLINVKEYIKNDCQTKCLDFLSRYITQFPDQDALNAIFGDRILKLPYDWGLLMFQAGSNLDNKIVKKTVENLKLAHLNGPGKPWNSPYRFLNIHFLPPKYPMNEIWRQIALKTKSFKIDLENEFLRAQNEGLDDYAESLSKKLGELEYKIERLRKKSLKEKYKKFEKRYLKPIELKIREMFKH